MAEARWRRDLRWAVASPPLLGAPRGFTTPSARWFRERAAALVDVPDDPPPRRAVFRLGPYFEALVGRWIRADPAYELVARNVTFRAGRRTVGELDFLVRERASARLLHWEVAVKFYLGRRRADGRIGFFGPNTADRLDLEWRQLVDRQLPRPHAGAAHAWLARRGLAPDASWSIVKGCLFRPLDEPALPAPAYAHSEHLRSWWASFEGFVAHARPRGLRWRFVYKPDWLAPLLPEDDPAPESIEPFLERLESVAARQAIMVAGFDGDAEIERAFVVAPPWLERTERDTRAWEGADPPTPASRDRGDRA